MWVWDRPGRLLRVAAETADLGIEREGQLLWDLGGAGELGFGSIRLSHWWVGREMGMVRFVRFSCFGLLGTSRLRTARGYEGGGWKAV